jgi:16S rRNA (guanine966-N2)-methyltransferase
MAVAVMRIIAGIAKGRPLSAPKGPRTRPMMDRAKEAIFSMLAPEITGARVLDLYAGSGSMGLEALSRGAASVVFVESWRQALTSLRANIDTVGLGGEVAAADVEEWFRTASGTFDIAFVDPPYDLPLPSVEEVLGRLVPRLSDGATVVVHRRSGSGEVAGPERLSVVDRRRYGDAEITRLTKEAGG